MVVLQQKQWQQLVQQKSRAGIYCLPGIFVVLAAVSSITS